MRRFFKTLTIIISLFLALFIQSSNVFACGNIVQGTTQQYISATRYDSLLDSDRKEEYFVITKNDNESEITNSSNKNDNLGYGGFTKTIFNYNISNDYITENRIYLICISHKISPNLKNAIYTRAP